MFILKIYTPNPGKQVIAVTFDEQVKAPVAHALQVYFYLLIYLNIILI